MWPPATAVTAPAAPSKGTCFTSIPASEAKSPAAMCHTEPGAEFQIFTFPG